MISAERFCAELDARGVGLVTGVPCGWLQGPLALLARQPGRYVPAANEGAALAIAAGAELAGQRSAVLIQNSGFGNLINPLTSLIDTFAVPVIIFMTLRGWPRPEDDEPQHSLTGPATEPLLSQLGVGHQVLASGDDGLAQAWEAADRARAGRRPYAVLVPRGRIGRVEEPQPDDDPSGGGYDRGQAIEDLVPWLRGSAVFATTGRTSRELFTRADSPAHFYMLGSMGHALALGLGAAISRPDRRIVVLDGDGALVMHLGTALTVGAQAPANLIHIVLDNQTYDSTGGQPVPGPADWRSLGHAAGYRGVHLASSPAGTARAMATATDEPGPRLVVLRVTGSGRRPTRHPLAAHGAGDLAARFHTALEGAAAGSRTRPGEPEVSMVSRPLPHDHTTPATPATPDPDTLRGEVLKTVAELLADEGRPVEVHDDDVLADLALDSIALMFVLTHFERRYDVAFDNDTLRPDRYVTVGDLAAFVAEQVSTRG
ncbi:thiamine pyrophosphate-dependent enzyme [Streptomyces longwoodensis]|uniref:thiamine pyrophosphate-dependent enzyme n=1 Tax=Streptomyces longwoodensis TaxID=68231 RepID=UPI0033D6CF43